MALKTYADGTIFGEKYGTGEPSVLALHGWGRSRGDFGEVLAGLDAISLDLPGFGASPAPEAVIGAAGYAELIEPIVAEFAQPPVIVGHSFGGRVAVALAANNPAAVGGLVLVGVPLVHRVDRPVKPPPFAYRLVRWANKLGVISDDRLEREKRKRGSEDYRQATGVMRDILVKAVNETYEHELSQIMCPVEMVWGENDDDVPVSVARQASELIPNASLTVIEGVGHHVQLNNPLSVRAAIDALQSGRSS